MKSFDLTGSLRTIAERSSEQQKVLKAMRKECLIPCVIYGGEKNVNFSVKSADVRKLVYTPDIHYVNLTIDGEVHTAIVREIQFHPVKDTILHMDFLEINDKKPIVMEVPLKLQGLAVGVKAGGKMRQLMRTLKVKALYTNIPEMLTIDVTDMGQRELAYEINDAKSGYYYVITVQANDDKAISEFDRLARNSKDVVRHLITKKED